jgi:hypothetical protein
MVPLGVGVAVATAALAVGALGDAAAEERAAQFIVSLTGNTTARVDVSCDLKQASSGKQTETFAGRLPIRRTFEGQSLSCRIEQTAAGGRVDVSLSSTSGNVSRLSVAGAGSRIQVAVR